jgi:hypothetical protein
MKALNILLVSSLLLVAHFSAHSQYNPLLGQHSTWYTNHINQGIAYVTQAIVLHDSVVNNVSYKVVDRYGSFIPQYYLMREDTTTRKVYLLEQSGVEVLVYDFSLQVGDTFYTEEIGVPPLSPHTLVLDSITDSLSHTQMTLPYVEFYQSSPRIFHFSQPGIGLRCIWAEGIGSLGGFNSFYLSTFNDMVLCHYDSLGQKTFHNYVYTLDSLECYWVDGLETAYSPITNLKFSIYPNPATSKITIDVTLLGANEPITMQIVDILGRTVHSESIQLQKSSYTVNTSEWKPGIYSVIFSDGNKRSTQKVIITTQ